jgi:hypothetical protein
MDITKKNLVLIHYLQSLFQDYQVKAEFSTNDKDKKVIVVQEQPGEKVVFFGDITPLFNYYQINIFGLSIRENKNTATQVGELIGKHILVDYEGSKWQIIFSQYSNPQAIEYLDIRRVGYSATLKCVVNQIA